MLFMGPQTLLDLFAQFKQSLEKVTEALLLQRLPPAPWHPALCSQRGACMPARAACASGSDLMPLAVTKGPWPRSHERQQQQHPGAATSPQAPHTSLQSAQHFAKPVP